MSAHEKGRAWRKLVQTHLERAGCATTYRPLGEAGDDITATLGALELSIECKNHKALALAEWVTQAESNAGRSQIAIVIAHRRGRASVDDAYCILSGRALIALLGYIE